MQTKNQKKKFGQWMTAREYLLSDLQQPNFVVEKKKDELLAIREEMHAEIEKEKTHYGATPPTQEYHPEDVKMTPPNLNEVPPDDKGIAETLKFLEDYPEMMLPEVPVHVEYCERLEPEQEHKMIAIKTNMRSYQRMKELYLQANMTKLKNHYYTGFFAILLCDNHVNQHVLDSFPCRVKKVFLLNADKCKYCKDKRLIATRKQLHSLMNLPKGNNCNIPKFYYIMSK